MISPSTSRHTISAILCICLMLWDTITIVIPRLFFSFTITSSMFCVDIGSKALVGSSNNKTYKEIKISSPFNKTTKFFKRIVNHIHLNFLYIHHFLLFNFKQILCIKWSKYHLFRPLNTFPSKTLILSLSPFFYFFYFSFSTFRKGKKIRKNRGKIRLRVMDDRIVRN